MRTLATLQKPDSGTITYNGVNILHDPDIIRSGLGYLPQDFGVYPKMSALALLDHIAILKGIINISFGCYFLGRNETAVWGSSSLNR